LVVETEGESEMFRRARPSSLVQTAVGADTLRKKPVVIIAGG
jgi:hypothetical protein